MKDSLQAIKTVFIRKPLYRFTDYEKIPESKVQLDDFVNSLWLDTIFKEGLFLASEDLYLSWKRVFENEIEITSKDKHKLNVSILKYYIRITTRSTPFGIFSSYSSYIIKSGVNSINKEVNKYTRVSSLNVEFLLNLIDYINTTKQFRDLHHFRLNSSIYRMGSSFRYIEKLRSSGKQEFVLSSIEADEVLDLITDSLNGSSMSFVELICLLMNNVADVSDKEVSEYLEGLISSQYLVTDFDLCLNSGKPLDQLIDFISKNKNKSHGKELEFLETHLLTLKHLLLNLDSRIGNDIILYKKIYKAAEKTNVTLPSGSLVHVNLKEHIVDLEINDEDIKNVKKAISVLTAFTPTDDTTETTLAQFGKAFYERYEDQAVPLVKVLDTESGIGYKQSQLGENDFSTLIDDLEWPALDSDIETIKFNNKKHTFWKEVIREASETNKPVDLKKIDIGQFKASPDLLARSFSALTKKIGSKIFVDTVGGNTALGLIARFSTDDSSVQELVREIVLKEEIDDNVIHVELLFLPNEKAGNIVVRHVPRKYELPYLTKSSCKEIEININDLYIQSSNGKFAIYSKKLNKRLKIYHSNAHNYHYNSLPVYQFLCDLQMQDEYNLTLDIGRTNFLFFDYIPRITYGENIILSPATWRITYRELIKTEYAEYDYSKIKERLEKRRIPRYLYLSHSDNKLLIDTDNEITLEILLEELKKKKELILSEFLYDLKVEPYDNEIVFSFINESIKKITNNAIVPDFTYNDVKRIYIPGDEWLYYKIYTGNKFTEKFLLDILPEINKEFKSLELVDKWFFIRYTDPAPHLRLRFHLTESSKITTVVAKMNMALNYFVNESLINKIEISTYKREVERYEGKYIALSESIFCCDSELVLELKKICDGNNNEWLYSLKCIDEYFNLFSFSIQKRLTIMESLSDSFNMEFNATPRVRKQIDLKYRNHAKEIDLLFNSAGEEDKAIELIEGWSSSHFPEIHEQLEYLPEHRKVKLVISLLHMHINRMLKARQRMHEFVIYTLLLKYYKSKIGRLKYNS